MNTLIFHTLQSGHHDFRRRHHEDQPPMLALMAGLYDPDGVEISRMLRIVDLQGTLISNETTSFHGIDNDMMADEGLPLAEVLGEFEVMLSCIDVAMAFSVDHHMAVLGIALQDVEMTLPRPVLGCLMRKSVNICRIVDRRGNFKFPKLEEAYRHFSGQPMPTFGGGQSAEQILDNHLAIRTTIYQGIRSHEAGEISKAAAPLFRPMGEWS
jgi:hypothetical protein